MQNNDKNLDPVFTNPNKPVSDNEFKKIQKKRVIVISCLGILTIICLIAMILVLVLVKK